MSAQTLLDSLSQPQQDAIRLVKLSLDCFNSADGTGLFTGVNRYNTLEQRLPLAALKARSIFGFWAALLNIMKWPVPPKYADEKVVEALAVSDPQQVLRTLATEAQAVVMIARMLHDADKATRRAIRAEMEAAELPPEFHSSLEDL